MARRKHLIVAVCFIAAFILGYAPSGVAATRALLVGVSDYDDAIGFSDLRGPANDVVLMRRVLEARGVDTLTVLADGVEGAQSPTRGRIDEAFADLAAEAKRGDLVIVYLSGHGTRQPDQNGDEADGFDEVFLPADVTPAAPGSGEGIPNALVDDDIGAAVRAIREKGADVWLIMDSCHSGTGVRAAFTSARARFVDPAILGVSRSATVPLRETGIADPEERLPSDAGGLVAFYAAQSTEQAIEVDFAAGEAKADGENAWYGLFTSALARRLEHAGGISYAQLFQAVLKDMNASAVPGGRALQTPYREGDLQDAVVLGGAASIGIRQFPVSGETLDAGLIHGVRVGALYTLVEDPTAPEDASIGLARVTDVQALSATVTRVTDACLADAEGAACQPDASTTIPDTAYARLAAPSFERTLRLSVPVDAATGGAFRRPAGVEAELLETLADVAALPATRLGTSLVLDAPAFDVGVSVEDGRLRFQLGAATGASGVAWPAGAAEAEPEMLIALLRRMARAVDLMNLEAAIADSQIFALPAPVRISPELWQAETLDLQAATLGRIATGQECTALMDRGAYSSDPAELTGAKVGQCDMVVIKTEQDAGAYDVNMLYIDAGFDIVAKHRRIEGRGRDKVFHRMLLCSDCPNGRSIGPERAIFIVTEAAPNADQLNLEWLNRAGGPPANTRSAANADPASRLLLDYFKPETATRGSFAAALPPSIWVESVSWQVMPLEAILTGRLAID